MCSKEGRKEQGRNTGEVGIQAKIQEQIKYEGAGKQAGMQGESEEG